MSLKAWFGWLELVSLLAGFAAMGALALVAARDAGREQERGRYLEAEVAKLEAQIVEVYPVLRSRIQELLARKLVVEALDRDRGETVQLLDQIARRRPAGVSVAGIRKTGRRVRVDGFASSQAVAATFVANLSGSPILEHPVLIEARHENGEQRSDYSVRFAIEAALPRSK